jgi:xanthine dehydrogenase accessory factor
MGSHSLCAVVRGGGDLASGAAARLRRCGIPVVLCELPRPLAIRRLVSFAEAVYAGEVQVEELIAFRTQEPKRALTAADPGRIPVVVDPEGACIREIQPMIVVDARMRKAPPGTTLALSPLVIGLGPGFNAGVDCHAVIETRRGHRLGRVLWHGSADADTGIPGEIGGEGARRVLRAPCRGTVAALARLGEPVQESQAVVRVNDEEVRAPFGGVLRGLLHDGLEVEAGDKIGDIDPRADRLACTTFSDKALAVGGGVLEAVFSQAWVRTALGGLA